MRFSTRILKTGIRIEGMIMKIITYNQPINLKCIMYFRYKVKKVSKLGELFIETDPAVNMDLSLHSQTGD